jgi:formamidopyrimidine-DNA glycosylase
MPELPEVETVVSLLCQCLVGERVAGVEVRWAGSIATPIAPEFARELLGREVLDVGRRGKFVVISLSGAKTLLVHLRMTGQLLVDSPCPPGERALPDAYTRVVVRLESGRALTFRDTRKFGRLYLVDDPQAVVGHLGPEPLAEGFTARQLLDLLHARPKRLKPLLTDQRTLAGLGNIYVDEALWEAGLHPLRKAHTLSAEEAGRLHEAIRKVLEGAIANMGTTLRDYRTPRDEPGTNQGALRVYGRRGEPCPRCGGTIQRQVVGGRGTYVCPACQPPPGQETAQEER